MRDCKWFLEFNRKQISSYTYFPEQLSGQFFDDLIPVLWGCQCSQFQPRSEGKYIRNHLGRVCVVSNPSDSFDWSTARRRPLLQDANGVVPVISRVVEGAFLQAVAVAVY